MLDKPVMIITGTRKGIGKYLAEYYSDKEYQVVGCSRGDIDFELKNYQHFCVDVCDEKEVRKMFSQIRKTFGRLDVLINNAGVNYALSPVLLVPYESALKTIEINLLSTFLISRESIKIMMKNSFGRIINFGSMAVKHEVKGEAIYTASKAAIVSFTKVISKEIYDYGITCNVISPSAIATDLMMNISNTALNKVLGRNAIPDKGKLEDISNTINWLIKPNSLAITGQNIYLGGV
jgi:3-oxoacyl-[acyl-carrier protein] reductase